MTTRSMDRVRIERVGGFAGFGGPGSKLKSTGEVTLSRLSDADRAAIESLFTNPVAQRMNPDAFRYRMSRDTPNGVHTIEVAEASVPDSIKASVTDRLA